LLVTILRSSVQLSPLGGATPAGRRRIDRKYYRSALSSVADVIDSQRVARSALPSPAPLRARCFGRPSVRRVMRTAFCIIDIDTAAAAAAAAAKERQASVVGTGQATA